MTVSVVFGATGAIGRFLVPRLVAAGDDVIAISRTRHVGSDPRVRWLAGDLDRGLPHIDRADTVYSLGPLDAFARRIGELPPARIVAIGSMSAITKQDSIDAAERDLARRLLAAEAMLLASAGTRGCAATILRATLIYGAGLDRSLTPIARFAMRWRVFPYPAGARGLRQPVHADDLAAAAMKVARTPATAQRIYALGGGERIAFTEMMLRVRASLPVATLPLAVPIGPARILAGLARGLPGARAAGAAAFARIGTDLVADSADAARDFGWTPRRFAPDASDWTPRPPP